jgi:hypothetical protein
LSNTPNINQALNATYISDHFGTANNDIDQLNNQAHINMRNNLFSQKNNPSIRNSLSISKNGEHMAIPNDLDIIEFKQNKQNDTKENLETKTKNTSDSIQMNRDNRKDKNTSIFMEKNPEFKTNEIIFPPIEKKKSIKSAIHHRKTSSNMEKFKGKLPKLKINTILSKKINGNPNIVKENFGNFYSQKHENASNTLDNNFKNRSLITKEMLEENSKKFKSVKKIPFLEIKDILLNLNSKKNINNTNQKQNDYYRYMYEKYNPNSMNQEVESSDSEEDDSYLDKVKMIMRLKEKAKDKDFRHNFHRRLKNYLENKVLIEKIMGKNNAHEVSKSDSNTDYSNMDNKFDPYKINSNESDDEESEDDYSGEYSLLF